MDKKKQREELKKMIQELHAGKNPEQVKEQFKEWLDGVEPGEITKIEEELIIEGVSRDEIHRLCDVHIALMKEGMETPQLDVKPGHPIYILIKEHEFMKSVLAELVPVIEAVCGSKSYDEYEWEKAGELLGHFREYDKHKIREENCLFPYLEKYGVTQPPAIMWMEHDEQRKIVKKASALLAEKQKHTLEEFKVQFLNPLRKLCEIIPSHFYKEENILFPTALKLISPSFWLEIKASMDDLGYCAFTPKEAIGEFTELVKPVEARAGHIVLPTGDFSLPELETLLNTLPVELSFVDKDNKVRFFTQTKERIFPRTTAVLGRKVQNCHPEKSVHLVERLIEDFRRGLKDVAEFWINLQGRLVYIRYFALRDDKGAYLGCVEVVQDVTQVKKLSGEKRLA